ASWGLIAPEVVRDTRVCVYDRAGRGWSDPAPSEQDGFAVVADLSALLAAAHESSPYVIVGHSFGGLYVRAFAARYPQQTAALVLLDATPPRAFTGLPSYPKMYGVLRRVTALFPSLARFGIGRLVYGLLYGNSPNPWRTEQVMFSSTARTARSTRDEFAMA